MTRLAPTLCRLARASIPAGMAFLVACLACQSPDPAPRGQDDRTSSPPRPSTGGQRPAGTGHDSLHAEVMLVAEDRHLVPGQTHWLGLHLRPDPGWHLYWNGRNDSGYAPILRLELPAGLTAGELVWPAPVRHLGEGEILDHVYEEEATLLFPVTIDAQWPAERPAVIQGTAEWLACREACVPESMRVSITLEAGAAGTRSLGGVAAGASAADRSSPTLEPDETTAPLFAAARARVPRLWNERESAVRLAWESGALRIESPGATRLLFYPLDSCTALSHPIEDGDQAGSTLRLRFSPAAGERPRAAGVLEVRHGETTTAFFTIDQAGDRSKAG